MRPPPMMFDELRNGPAVGTFPQFIRHIPNGKENARGKRMSFEMRCSYRWVWQPRCFLSLIL